MIAYVTLLSQLLCTGFRPMPIPMYCSAITTASLNPNPPQAHLSRPSIPKNSTPQARLEQVCGLSPGSIERFEFQGQTLSGQEDLRKAGISTGVSSTISSSNRGGSGSGADEALYPNAWFASPLTKAYQRVSPGSCRAVRGAFQGCRLLAAECTSAGRSCSMATGRAL